MLADRHQTQQCLHLLTQRFWFSNHCVTSHQDHGVQFKQHCARHGSHRFQEQLGPGLEQKHQCWTWRHIWPELLPELRNSCDTKLVEKSSETGMNLNYQSLSVIRFCTLLPEAVGWFKLLMALWQLSSWGSQECESPLLYLFDPITSPVPLQAERCTICPLWMRNLPPALAPLAINITNWNVPNIYDQDIESCPMPLPHSVLSVLLSHCLVFPAEMRTAVASSSCGKTAYLSFHPWDASKVLPMIDCQWVLLGFSSWRMLYRVYFFFFLIVFIKTYISPLSPRCGQNCLII